MMYSTAVGSLVSCKKCSSVECHILVALLAETSSSLFIMLYFHFQAIIIVVTVAFVQVCVSPVVFSFLCRIHLQCSIELGEYEFVALETVGRKLSVRME